MVVTPKGQALGREMKNVRERVGATARAIAEQMGVSTATISRWESGNRSPRPEDVASYLTALRAPNGVRNELIDMARDTEGRQWLAVGYPEQGHALAALLEAERDATHIVSVSPLIIPGLLQTVDYARSIIGAGGVPAEEVEIRVKTRVGRRSVLTGRNAPAFLALLGEAALRRLVGGPQVQSDQLRVLLEISRLPSVDLRVIPFTAPWSPDMEGLYDWFAFRDRDPVVHVENRRSALVFHDRDDVAPYEAATDTVMRVAMSSARTSELILDVISELEATP
ncbi:helix-turn-helix domain-containing protein [Actinoalloteichus hymeniacidonis]|uniref:DNA binding protein with helix-turn-helix domain n=1 Tax=Actinoalloteichus hymeniacidonis TaxID=340345 RepID=A0AAC9HR75_9PSEU|nr:helix-turn-helix transcriptional regulator [Actinoalloteichus hymeniacidonis]AOS64087.1 DNA binding protein with helix-turn-helix domain [Actinoalloteichus hymeniacidonis]MBB5907850.1 transcriptional regulator with XRE-family HTH domain [Actinoalloteichus hymeniacidonis]